MSIFSGFTGARQSHRDAEDARIARDYEQALAIWSVKHNCHAWDYTLPQLERIEALRAAGGDVRVAKHLLYGQTIYDLGLMTDGVMP